MLKFYYSPRSSASRVHVAIEELGVPYEKIRVHLEPGKEEQKKPEFLAINPNGKIPALVDGDAKVFESLACILWLGEKYGVDKGLWPKLGTPEHAEALSWCIWGNTELGPAVLDYVLHATDAHFAFDKKDRSAFVAEVAKETWTELTATLDKRLEGREWLLGKFSLVDVAVGLQVGMGVMFGGLTPSGKNVAAWGGRIQSRPSFGKVMSET